MKAYSIDVELSEQSDGLWRAQVAELPGCFVDAPTVAEALRDVQEAAAMFIDLCIEEGRPVPASVKAIKADLPRSKLVIVPEQHTFKRPANRSQARTSIS